MALTLTSDVTATDAVIGVTGTIPDVVVPGYEFRLNDEALRFTMFATTTQRNGSGRRRPAVDPQRWNVERGIGGTTPAAHAQGVTVKGAVDAFASADTETPPTPWASGGGGGGSITASDEQVVYMDGTDAVGNDALKFAFSAPNAYLTIGGESPTLRLGDQVNGAAAIVTYGAGTELVIAAAAGVGDYGGELDISSGDGIDGGALSIRTGAGLSDANSGSMNIRTGDAGGSSGEIIIRAGLGAWQGGQVVVQGGNATDSSGGNVTIQGGASTNGTPGNVQIYDGGGNNLLQLDATGFRFFGGFYSLASLPTSDPGVVGRLYTDGAPSAGVPKALMVSGG